MSGPREVLADPDPIEPVGEGWVFVVVGSERHFGRVVRLSDDDDAIEDLSLEPCYTILYQQDRGSLQIFCQPYGNTLFLCGCPVTFPIVSIRVDLGDLDPSDLEQFQRLADATETARDRGIRDRARARPVPSLIVAPPDGKR